MLGKILRLAFMDKHTRARWEAARAQAPAGRVESKRGGRAAGGGAASAGATAGAAESSPDGPSAVAAPSAEVSAAAASAESAERRQLIHNAMTIHKMKQSALDDLDADTRARLRDMAEQVFGVDDRAEDGSGGGSSGGDDSGSGSGGGTR